MMTAPATAQSDIQRISIVAGTELVTAQSDMARGIHRSLQQAWPQLSIDITEPAKFTAKPSQPTLVIALGDALLPWLVEHQSSYAGAIAFYVSAVNFAAAPANQGKLTALYRDQPLQRQLALARLLDPKLKRAAILRGEKPLPLAAGELAQRSGIAITEIISAQPLDAPKLLAQAMRSHDVLLGIDDASIYNSESIRSILLTAYRHGKGVIGPNRAFVTAGSLASCYTLPDQYLQQLLTMVAAAISESKLPRPQYPQHFRVAVNPQVAASLGLNIPNEQILSAWPQNYQGDCGDGC